MWMERKEHSAFSPFAVLRAPWKRALGKKDKTTHRVPCQGAGAPPAACRAPSLHRACLRHVPAAPTPKPFFLSLFCSCEVLTSLLELEDKKNVLIHMLITEIRTANKYFEKLQVAS